MELSELLDQNLQDLQNKELQKYHKMHPNAIHPANAKRYFRQAEFIEMLEKAAGHEIKFIQLFPLDNQNMEYDIEIYTYEYIKGTRPTNYPPANARDQLIKQFYELSRHYAEKLEYFGHPLSFRDIIGIETTNQLLREAKGRFIDVYSKASGKKQQLTAADLSFVFLEDNEWYDDKNHIIRTDEEF